MALIATASLTASAEYVTVKVCGLNEAGTCQMVTYKVRPASPAQEVVETCSKGEAEGACPTVTGIPAWLQALNDAFPANDGSAAPEQNDIYAGGPN